MNTQNNMSSLSPDFKLIIAFIGMPGSGKSEATKYLQKKGIPSVRFGDLTDESVKRMGLELTESNERVFREKIRKELGMAAYAIKAKPKIDALSNKYSIIILDGLYSWEEYLYLKKDYPSLILVHIYAEPVVRYKRLADRKVRPVSYEDSRKRDIEEIQALNKGGPIAIADYLIQNNNNIESNLYQEIDALLERLQIAS